MTDHTAAPAHDDPPTMHDVDTPAQIVTVYAVVIVLAAANMAISFAPLGKLALPVQLAIGVVQTLCVALYWMHMRRGDTGVTMCVLTALFFMFIFFVLVFSDILTRHWIAL